MAKKQHDTAPTQYFCWLNLVAQTFLPLTVEQGGHGKGRGQINETVCHTVVSVTKSQRYCFHRCHLLSTGYSFEDQPLMLLTASTVVETKAQGRD